MAKPTISASVVISQVYGGGGNTGATYKNDFVELFNRSSSTVNLSGWTVQYASASGSFSTGNSVALSGTLAPGQYYLVQLASGGSVGADLPTPNASGSFGMAANNGKVALASTSTPVTGSTDATVVDFVGYGTGANDYEGSTTPNISATTSASRGSNGCSDTDNNRNDFTAGAVNPRNTNSPLNNCGAALTATPTALTNFVTTTGTASDEQSYVLSGSSLNSAVTVAAPAGYKASFTSGGPYSSTITTGAPVGGSVSASVYVILDGSTSGAATGTITNTSGATVASVAVSGTVNAPVTSTQVVRWDGGAGTSFWFDAANWSTDAVPTSATDVMLDHTFVAGKYRVLLQSATTTTATPESAVSILSLAVNPGSGDSILFEIPALNTNGSALTITRSGAGEVALAIYDKGVVTNSTGSGGTGATTGAGLTVANSSPTLYLYNGGSYRHYTNRAHVAVLDNLAVVSGTENGRWEFRVTNTASYSVSLSNRSYPTLVLRNNVAATATSYTGSGASLTIRGRLLIEPGVTFSPNITGDFKIAGDIVGQGALRFAPSLSGNPATGRLLLNGTAPQRINGTAFGTTSTGSYLSSGVTVQINNPNGIILSTPVTVNGTLLLTSGQVLTDASNLLTLAAGATVSGGSTASFVNGPLAYTATGPATLQFPLGRSTEKGAAYRPLTLSITTLAAPTTFMATQTEGNAGGSLNSGLARVSTVRYFTITPFPVPAAGSFAGKVSLSFGADDRVTTPEASSLVIAKNSGAGWENIGRSGYTGTASSGTITSGVFTSFSQFAFGSTDAGTAFNPLPVELTSFTAQRSTAGATLRWTTATELNCQQFDVLRSADGVTFTRLSTIPGHGTTTQPQTYQYVDVAAGPAATYYRLRQVDTDGHTAESPTRSVTAVLGNVYSYPNPVGEELTVHTPTAAQLRILDEAGYVVYHCHIEAGTTHHRIAQLPAGVYVLEVQAPGQPAVRQKLLKTK